jgi:predicted KAP-like P-loop ATPase
MEMTSVHNKSHCDQKIKFVDQIGKITQISNDLEELLKEEEPNCDKAQSLFQDFMDIIQMKLEEAQEYDTI